jgi:hypothetical protein
MNRKQSTKKGGTKGKAEGSKTKARGVALDLIEVEREQNGAVRALVKLLDMPGLPDFITSGVCMMLAHAATVKGVDITVTTGGYDPKSLGVLFALTSGYQSDLEFEPEKDLPALIAAVMNHPDLPASLEEGFGEALNDLFNELPTKQKRIDHHPAYIALLLDAEKGARAEGEGGAS